jgi:hypothetical protein
MAVPQRKKVFFIALALTMTALIVDRLFVLPKSAGAEDTQAMTGADAGGLMASLPDLPEIPAHSLSLAGRLESVVPDTPGAEDPGRDAFAVSALWGAATGSQVLGGPVGEFIRRHRLTAVAVDGQTAHALIDERMMVPGQQLDGFTLVSIQEDHVVFASGESQFVLSLASDL